MQKSIIIFLHKYTLWHMSLTENSSVVGGSIRDVTTRMYTLGSLLTGR